MNVICEKCDTRCRLGMCKGRDNGFKFCFRRIGTITDLEETITPFTTLHELYEKCNWLNFIIPESLILDNQPYVGNDNMVLLFGRHKRQETDRFLPLGYVTVLTTKDMEQIYYVDEEIPN